MKPLNPRAVRALARRTFDAFLETPSATAALLVFYLLTGYLFAMPLFLSGQASIRSLLAFAPLLLTLLTPALTMGLLAEELRSGTFETLVSYPLEDWDIVLGKYLGFAALLALLVAGLLFYPLLLSALAAPPGVDWGESLGLLLGLLLQGLLFGAIGLWASSLTRSQAAAFLISFAACFALLVCGKLAALLPAPAAVLTEFLGVDSHLETLAKGVVDLRDLAYFATGTAAFLLLAVQSLEARRGRSLLSWAGAVAALLALACANAGASYARARLDFSAGRAYTLSGGTKALLRGLKEPLLVQAYFSSRLPPPFSLQQRYLRDLLAEYRAAGRGKVRVEWLDPDKDEKARARASAAGVTPVQINVTGRDRFEAQEAWMGVVLLHGGKTETMPVIEEARDLEYALTRRVKRLADPRRRVVGFSSGHGETGPEETSLAPFFAAAGEVVETRAVRLDKPLPPEVGALWVVGPASKLKAAELEALRAFAASGKTLVVMANTRLADFVRFQASAVDAGLGPLLEAWGLSLGQGLVVDAQSERVQMETQLGPLTAMRLVEYPFIPLITRLDGAHPALSGIQVVSFPFSSPLLFDAAKAPGTAFLPLARSSHQSWLSQAADLSPAKPLSALKTDAAGPFALAGLATGPAGKLLLIGTPYQLDARLLRRASTPAFLLNLMEWSVQDEALLAARGKGLVFRPLRPLPDAARAAAKYSLILSLPSAALVAAVLGHRRRRRRREALPAAYADA